MATFRSSTLLRQALKLNKPSAAPARTFISGGSRRSSALTLGTVAAATACGSALGYYLHTRTQSTLGSAHVLEAASKASKEQPSVISGTKEHALYLWIKLSSSADAKQCAHVVSQLQQYVDLVCPPDLRDESDEVIAGVGFSPKFYSKIGGSAAKDYKYATKNGSVGAMPAKQGDIFIHAKSDSTSKLFELAQQVMKELPSGAVSSYEDIYGFVYRNGRDLSGFIDGTENPADDEERSEVAIEPSTGGSYVITQKWVHNMDIINSEKDAVKESFVGRQIDDSTELQNKVITSHVARMTGGADFNQKKVHRIVRQSQPYGNLHDRAGLFFIAYSHTPEAFEYMLDRMVGKDKDRHVDNIMKLTTCVASTYWYFPGIEQLKKL